MKTFKNHLKEKRCWPGYKPAPGKEAYSKGSCVKEETLEEGRPSQRHPLEGHDYHKKTDAELTYIAKDAHKAAEAMKGHNEKAENKYRDQANDSATVRYWRQKNGMPDWYKKKYGHIKEEVEIDEATAYAKRGIKAPEGSRVATMVDRKQRLKWRTAKTGSPTRLPTGDNLARNTNNLKWDIKHRLGIDAHGMQVGRDVASQYAKKARLPEEVEQINEVGDTRKGRIAAAAVADRAHKTMDAWSKNPKSGFSSTPAEVRKATKTSVIAGNRAHGFGPGGKKIKLKQEEVVSEADNNTNTLLDIARKINPKAKIRPPGGQQKPPSTTTSTRPAPPHVQKYPLGGYDPVSNRSYNEEVEQIDEIHTPGTRVKVPHNGKIVSGKIVRHDKGDRHGSPFYVVDVGSYASEKIPTHKVQKEEIEIEEDWQKVNKSDNTDGLSQKAVDAYRRENPGSKLKTAVTKDPSKLKAGSKDAKRRLSFCRRMRGMKNRLTNPENARDPDSPVNKALRRWNC